MRAAVELAWRLRAANARENRVPGVLAVLALPVATAACVCASAASRPLKACDDDALSGSRYLSDSDARS